MTSTTAPITVSMIAMAMRMRLPPGPSCDRADMDYDLSTIPSTGVLQNYPAGCIEDRESSPPRIEQIIR